MTMTIHADPVPLWVDEHGDVRVGNSRVLLDVILGDYQNGQTAEEIADGYDTITLADVHGVLAYYHRHKEEVDEYLRARDERAEELRRQIQAANGPKLASLKARIDALKAQRSAGNDSPTQ